MARMPLTSNNNPLRIAEIAVGSAGGRIGITFAPGKQQPGGLTGAHRRDLAADLDAIAAWNAAVVVTLVEPHELDSLGIATLGAEVRRRHMEWHHWPIQDYSVPDAAFEAAWPARSIMLRTLLACGGRALIHCKGGLGRAGTISARLLVESGMAPGDAIRAVRAVRPDAIETGPQERWVAAGRAVPVIPPGHDRNTARDRAVGALLGLAVGDAVGAALEFSPKPRFAVLDDMTQGGPHHLARGQWTDDTAMALALADSLALAPGLDPADLIRRFLDWRDTGAYSCTGTCFDIGNATRTALERFRRTGEPLAGAANPAASGNGALMRLAPVAIRHWRNREVLQQGAALQTRTTHGSPATLAASGVLADMLADAIAGASLPEVLASPAAGRIEGGWRGLHRDVVEGSGWVVQALQAAVWAVARTTDFRSAVLLAANLGDDADSTAAIAGQLAGAIYGAAGIPPGWLDALAWRGRLESAAAVLFDAAWPEAHTSEAGRQAEDEDGTAADATLGDGPAACWMTRDWTLRERLAALAGFRTEFELDRFQFAIQMPSKRDGDLITLGWSSLGDEAERFYQMVYDYGWVRMSDWTAWRDTEAGRRLMQDPDAMGRATEDDLMNVLTTCIRADRFCDGYLAGAYDAGLIGRAVLRAGELLTALEARFGPQP
ncbi:MAG: ADP-ribosylglycohydrolase family protein [Janthinobacterium lividum]